MPATVAIVLRAILRPRIITPRANKPGTIPRSGQNGLKLRSPPPPPSLRTPLLLNHTGMLVTCWPSLPLLTEGIVRLCMYSACGVVRRWLRER
jgi:hypothetical protein